MNQDTKQTYFHTVPNTKKLATLSPNEKEQDFQEKNYENILNKITKIIQNVSKN